MANPANNERGLTPTAHGASLCGAKLKRRDGTCRNPAGFKTDHVGVGRCHLHMGNSESHRIAGARTLAESRIRRALDEVGVRELTNPLAELQALTAEVVAWKDHTANHVADLEGELTLLLEGEEIGDKTLVVTEQIKAVVPLYERALDRAGKFLEVWARLGIDAMLAAMQVRVTEEQAATLAKALEAYRVAAGVTPEGHRAGVAALERVMRP